MNQSLFFSQGLASLTIFSYPEVNHCVRMSEPLLKAILRLFAVVAREDEVTKQEREQVGVFLDVHLSQSAAAPYLDLFDNYVQSLPPKTGVLTAELSQLEALCREVNLDLTLKQKVVIILELFNIILADGKITSRESELVNAIGANFKILPPEVEAIKTFVIGKQATALDHPRILVVDSSIG